MMEGKGVEGLLPPPPPPAGATRPPPPKEQRERVLEAMEEAAAMKPGDLWYAVSAIWCVVVSSLWIDACVCRTIPTVCFVFPRYGRQAQIEGCKGLGLECGAGASALSMLQPPHLSAHRPQRGGKKAHKGKNPKALNRLVNSV
jgi:hypothetical protein